MVHDPRSVLNRRAPPPHATVPYGPDGDQVVDLRLPAGRPPGTAAAPLVVVVHGGFWRPEYDRAHAGPLAADLAARGWPVAVVEYRRRPWPTPAADLAAALAAVPRRVLPPLRAAGCAPGGLLLAGHSAGGQLVLHAAADPVPGLRGVLALAPVADLPAAHRLDLDGGAVAALLGGGPAEVPDRYADADPCRRAPGCPVTVVHGAADAHVPPALSRAYAAAHRGVRLVELPDVEHFGLIDPRASAWPVVTGALTDLSVARPTGPRRTDPSAPWPT